jgi:ATP:cob(I)alamin adenosyltransferase
MKAGIYTRGGDAGQTSLMGGVRVDKDHLRVETYGTIDEGTSNLGLARATTKYDDICRLIMELQGELIPIMSEIATAPDTQLKGGPLVGVQIEQVARLEQYIDRYNAEWIQSGKFVRPGGSQASAALDMARSIFRRAERRLISLGRVEPINPDLLKYLNRLSDLLYVLARIEEQRAIIDTITALMPGLTPQPGGAQPGNGETAMDLTLTDSDRVIEAGIKCAREVGVPMVLAVVDPNGDLVAMRRMDDALIVSVTLAPHKAYTAAVVRVPTVDLARLAQPGESLYGLDVNMPRITLVGGGIPLKKNGQLVGAVGVSGGSVEQDVRVAEAMVAAF